MKAALINSTLAYVKEIARILATARDSDPLLWLELYCDGDGCPVREIHVRSKDYDHEMVALVKRQNGFRCPLCGERAKMHWVKTSDQQKASEERNARYSVSFQMRERDHRCRMERTGEDTLLCVSAAELLDDRLPPTPEGWFGKRLTNTTKRRFIREGEE